MYHIKDDWPESTLASRNSIASERRYRLEPPKRPGSSLPPPPLAAPGPPNLHMAAPHDGRWPANPAANNGATLRAGCSTCLGLWLWVLHRMARMEHGSDKPETGRVFGAGEKGWGSSKLPRSSPLPTFHVCNSVPLLGLGIAIVQASGHQGSSISPLTPP